MNTEQDGLVEKVFNLSFLKCIFQMEEPLSHSPLPASVSVSVKSMSVNINGIQVNIWRASTCPNSEMCESATLMLQKPGEKHEMPSSSIWAYTNSVPATCSQKHIFHHQIAAYGRRLGWEENQESQFQTTPPPPPPNSSLSNR